MPQRRSKTEMVCDLLLAISRGAVRPTRIMQRANLTWNSLLMYLYALASRGLVWREHAGNVTLYHLTPKGTQVLDAYLTVKQGLGTLKLENFETRTLTGVVKVASGGRAGEVKLAALVDRLGREGYSTLPRAVRGKSGVEHEFDVVARDPKGATHAFVFVPQVDDKTILRLFIKQLDTGLRVHVVYTVGPGSLATRRAGDYGIDLIEAKSLGPRRTHRDPGQRMD